MTASIISQRRAGGFIAAAAAAAAAVLGLDLITPLGIAVPALYVLPILLTWLIPGRHSTSLVAGGAVAATWAGVWFAPGAFSSIVVADRAMVSVLLLVVAWLLIKQKYLAQRDEAAQKALRENEAQMQRFIQQAPAAIAMFDTHMRYMTTSRRWLEDYGLVGQDLQGCSHYDIFPDIPERWKEVHRRCLAGAVERSDEELFERADGHRQWLRWEICPWRTGSDAVGGIVIFTEDVTQRKQAETTLQELNLMLEQRVKERAAELVRANERFEWVAKATHDGVWDWDLIHDSVYFSPRWKEMHGFQEADVLELSHDWAERIHPDDRTRVLGRLQDYWAGKHHEYWEEYRIRRKDGTYFWVLDRGVAVWDEQRRAVRMVGAETDITWRKEAEEAMHRREHEFRTLADNVPAFFSYIDQDRRYRFVNKRYEELFGRSDEEIMGMTMIDLLGPEGYEQVRPHLDTAFGGQTVSFEYRLSRPEAGDRWFAAQYVPDRDEKGKVEGLFILLGDVTALKLSEASLRDLSARLLQVQEEERQRIARELHDDFTQRLAALTLELHELRSTVSHPDSALSSRLQKLGASAERLATDLQQMAHRLHPSIMEHVGLEAAVREQVDEFAARTGVQAEVMVRGMPEAVPLEQATCLYRVLQESLQNVRKHAKATTVLVRLLGTAHGLGLCVHDDGEGFEAGQRTDNRHGLGLTSMEERVKQLNGTFHIRTKLGEGMEVHAWVPLENVKREA